MDVMEVWAVARNQAWRVYERGGTMQQMSDPEPDRQTVDWALSWLYAHSATVGFSDRSAAAEITVEVPSSRYDRTSVTVVEQSASMEPPSDWFLRAVARAERAWQAASGA